MLIEAVTCDSSIGSAAKLYLQALGLFKSDETEGAYSGDQLYSNTSREESLFYCGGSFASIGNAGVFCAYGYYARTYSSANLGFRSAFVNLPAT